MSTSDRVERMRRERGKALVRALHLSELESAGAKRKLALHRVDEQLDRIARLLPAALEGGVTLSEVARATGVSRPTLYELRARYSEQPGDVRLGVLQTVARMQWVSTDRVAEHLGRDPAKVLSQLVALCEEGLVEVDARPSEDGDEEVWALTAPEGYEALEHWRFFEDHDNERGEEP